MNIPWQPVKIIPSSTLFQRKVSAIMYDELVRVAFSLLNSILKFSTFTPRRYQVLTNNTYARTVSSVQPSWIADLSIYRRRSA